MSPFPIKMVDRWRDRAELGPGEGTFYWHVLLGRDPQARALAQEAQALLAPFPGLHFTPANWLHLTILVVGSTDDISIAQGQAMLAEAARLLAVVPPITETLSRIHYHPQAIMLSVDAPTRLTLVRDAVQAATQIITGRPGHTEGPATWTPHVTIAYS